MPGKHTTIQCASFTEIDQLIYRYSGYYPCVHAKNGILMYIDANQKQPLGYKHGKLMPGTIIMPQENIDMTSVITFNLEDQTVNTNSVPMDMEFLRLITEKAKELGFQSDTQDLLYQKLRQYRIDTCNMSEAEIEKQPVPALSPEEIKFVTNLILD